MVRTQLKCCITGSRGPIEAVRMKMAQLGSSWGCVRLLAWSDLIEDAAIYGVS